MRVRFEGGPHDGETHDVATIGARLTFPGNWEDRRAVYFEDEDRWDWAYPTVVYVWKPKVTDLSGDVATAEYSHTEPAPSTESAA